MLHLAENIPFWELIVKGEVYFMATVSMAYMFIVPSKHGVKMDTVVAGPNVIFGQKESILQLSCKVEVNFMPITLVAFWQFTKIAVLFSSYLVAYVCVVPSKQGIKTDELIAEKAVILVWDRPFLRFNWDNKCQQYENCFVDILKI